MPINVDNIKFYAPLNADDSLQTYGGGIDLSSEIVSDQLGNVFDNVSDQERIEGNTDFRKFFIYNHNSGAGSAWLNVKGWIWQNTLSGDDEISIAIGTDSDTHYEAAGYTFYKPDAIDHQDVLDIGTLLTNEKVAIWIKRIVGAEAAKYFANEFRLAFKSGPS